MVSIGSPAQTARQTLARPHLATTADWQSAAYSGTGLKKTVKSTLSAPAILASESTEIVFSHRSTSPTYLGFKFANSPSFSWVIFSLLR